MSATPATTTETILLSGDLSLASMAAVATTAATSTTPFGYAEAQANAIVTQVNLLVAQNKLIIALLKANGLFAESV